MFYLSIKHFDSENCRFRTAPSLSEKTVPSFSSPTSLCKFCCLVYDNISKQNIYGAMLLQQDDTLLQLAEEIRSAVQDI